MGIGTGITFFTMHIEFTWFLFRMVRGTAVGDWMCVIWRGWMDHEEWGRCAGVEKLDGAEGSRGELDK